MKTRYNNSNYGNHLRLTFKDAKSCTHPGDCTEAVKYLMSKRYVKKQLKEINPIKLIKELGEYGAWDKEQLSVHSDNLERWVLS